MNQSGISFRQRRKIMELAKTNLKSSFPLTLEELKFVQVSVLRKKKMRRRAFLFALFHLQEDA